MVFFVLFCFCLFFESSGVGPLLKGGMIRQSLNTRCKMHVRNAENIR